MKTIGIKSSSELIFNILLSALLLPLVFIFITIALDAGFEYGIHFTLYMGGLLLITIILALMLEIFKPKHLIQYDNDHIYINYFLKQHQIELKYFVGASARRFRLKGFKFDFGKVIIRSIEGKRVIYGVMKCEDVALELSILKNAYATRTEQSN
ncbi:hypothetical protein N7603_05000 [Acholeplasma vituli]|uniref:DUF304 domain-containing protein n=1 Tax=Paracholeplasma vituli TaxID=69473 RepID=A0ABT2PVN3_9MOLU|nr:hypothetical protein [Paracholeplasma vituli]MCU0105009.1 hypothetical protein [Paracholeplasma vituli]